MSIICPNCKHREPEGAIFCSDCGTKLIGPDGLSTAAIQATESIFTTSEPAPKPAAPLPVSGAQINLHIIRTGQIIPLEGRSDYTIGRVSDGQSILPDVDLSPFDAFTHGVSRLHATLRIRDEGYFIEDLGSSNGTRINNNKIPALVEQSIQHGDVISLGRFKIQALIRQD
jgi:pSer/pThr/pTyr-binding forkhead associated (FHA) protein